MAPDFFISYTKADRSWAEWIAWQLEAEGYTTSLQAWDFIPARDWAHEMQRLTTDAKRTIAVLSADYFRSTHGESEWRVAYAKDPTGEKGLLVPVRIDDCDPPGLLKTRVVIELAGLGEEAARAALIQGVRERRAKPTVEPSFPGRPGPSFPPAGDSGVEEAIRRRPDTWRVEVHVVWHPAFPSGEHYARSLFARFFQHPDHLSSRGLRIPAWHWWSREDAEDRVFTPEPLRLSAAAHAAIVVLMDSAFAAAPDWQEYLARTQRSLRADDRLLIVLTSGDPSQRTPADARATTVTLHDTPEPLRELLLLNSVTRLLCEMVEPEGASVPIFMSRVPDGDLGLVNSIRSSFYSSPALARFFSERPVRDEDDWEDDIAEHANSGLLLAFMTDAYVTHNLDVEIKAAQASGMPVVVIDALQHGDARDGHHAPTVLWRSDQPAQSAEKVLERVLREVLRSRYFRRRAQAICDLRKISRRTHVLLAAPDGDAALRAHEALNGEKGVVIYPDPPLNSREVHSLKQNTPELTFVTPLMLLASES